MNTEERPSTLPSLATEQIGSRSINLRQISDERDPPVHDFSEISSIISLYKEKHQKQLVLHKHQKAEETRMQMEKFSSHAQKSLFRKRCMTALSDLNGRLSTAKSDNDDIESTCQTCMDNFNQTSSQRWESMEKRQREEWAVHISNEPVETPAKFRRRSPELLELMRQERRLFFQSKFDDASKLREEIERIEKIESEAAKNAAYDSWNTAGEHLQNKFRREKEVLTQWIETRKVEEEMDKKRQIESIEKRKKLLGYEINTQKDILRASVPHTMRRNLLFDSSKCTHIPIVYNSIDIHKMSASLPPRSKEILSNL